MNKKNNMNEPTDTVQIILEVDIPHKILEEQKTSGNPFTIRELKMEAIEEFIANSLEIRTPEESDLTIHTDLNQPISNKQSLTYSSPQSIATLPIILAIKIPNHLLEQQKASGNPFVIRELKMEAIQELIADSLVVRAPKEDDRVVCIHSSNNVSMGDSSIASSDHTLENPESSIDSLEESTQLIASSALTHEPLEKGASEQEDFSEENQEDTIKMHGPSIQDLIHVAQESALGLSENGFHEQPMVQVSNVLSEESILEKNEKVADFEEVKESIVETISQNQDVTALDPEEHNVTLEQVDPSTDQADAEENQEVYLNTPSKKDIGVEAIDIENFMPDPQKMIDEKIQHTRNLIHDIGELSEKEELLTLQDESASEEMKINQKTQNNDPFSDLLETTYTVPPIQEEQALVHLTPSKPSHKEPELQPELESTSTFPSDSLSTATISVLDFLKETQLLIAELGELTSTEAARECLSKSDAIKIGALPIKLSGNQLICAVPDPKDHVVRNRLRLHTGKQILSIQASLLQIQSSIEKEYGVHFDTSDRDALLDDLHFEAS